MIVTLRPITINDTANIIRWRNSDIVRSMFIDRTLLTQETHNEWLNTFVSTGKVVQMIISLSSTGHDIGSIFLKDIDPIHHKAEFGIFIGEKTELGKGYGLSATKQIITYGFSKLKLHKIYLRVLKTNESAIRMYEKAGFKKIGIFIDDVFVDNTYLDIVFMEILNVQS